MRGAITQKIVEWDKNETLDKMIDKFGLWDYTTFGLLLVVSTLIGKDSLS